MILGESTHSAELRMKGTEKACDSGPSMETVGVEQDRKKRTLSPTCLLRTVAPRWRPKPQGRACEEKQLLLPQEKSESLTWSDFQWAAAGMHQWVSFLTCLLMFFLLESQDVQHQQK